VIAGGTLHLNVVAAVAVAGTVGLLAILLIFLGATLGRRSSRIFGAGLGSLLLGSDPARNLPCDACKALELKASLGPSATRLARAIESAKASVDGTLVCLGSQLVASSRLGAGVIDRTVLPRK
jgi:hypothetical protein